MPRTLELVAASSLLLAGSFACGGQSTDQITPPAHDARYIQGFDPPAEGEGFTRYILPPIAEIGPGKEAMWCQWITEASTEERDVLDIAGFQSFGGHHVIFYATTDIQPVGTVRECVDNDLVSIRYLGGIGGEGVTSTNLPPGVVFRIPKGVQLLANVHFVNATEKTIEGQGVMDLKMVPSDPNHVVASLFTNIDVDGVNIPAGHQATLDVYCDFQDDLSFFWYGNHMHALGRSAFTEIVRANGGGTEMLVEDRTWPAEATFNPMLKAWPIDQPLVINRGDRMHTQCNWNNDTSKDVTFPQEMCASFGFYIGSGVQMVCIQNNWTN